MEFADLPEEAQHLVTDQQLRFRDPNRMLEIEREELIGLLLSLVEKGLSYADAADIIATEFTISDPELVVALNVTRAGAK